MVKLSIMEGFPKITKKEVLVEKLEIMKTPKITSEKEDGFLFYTLIQKGLNPDFGESETILSKKISGYFENNPINEDIKNSLNELSNFGVNEEQMSNLALAYRNKERLDKLVKIFGKYYKDIKDPAVIYNKFFDILDNFSKDFSDTDISNQINFKIEEDLKKRKEGLYGVEGVEEKLIAFFRPDIKTTNIKKINFIPTNPVLKSNYGRNFSSFYEEQIIISNIDNIENQKHELSHGIINPIISKLFNNLSQEEKEKIRELACENLKNNYGENPLYLLREEFVKTYVEVFSNRTVVSVYSSNKLRNIILELYSNYEKSKNENFEQFVLYNFKNYISNY